MKKLVFGALCIGLLTLGACGGGGGADARVFIDSSGADAVPSACNLLTQTGCVAGEKCTWIRVSTGPSDAEQLGQVGCAINGTVAAESPCAYGASGATTGFDNCLAGNICLASPATEQATGTCRPMCSLADATLPCAAGYACGAYSKFFSNSSADMPLAGVCDPTCNPLSQIRDIDNAPACGSVDPAMPTRGCYGFPSDTAAPTDFSCTGAGTLGHREVVTPPIYTNSCLPGAIPMLRESSGSMQVVCITFCDPLTINNTTPLTNQGGAAPYRCPDMPLGVGINPPPPRATGAGERCQHLWFWEGNATPVTTASNDYGYCVDFTKYTWDDDMNAATPPVPWRLPETTTPCANIADPATWTPLQDCFWGTVPLPTTLTGSHQGAPRAEGLGFRPLTATETGGRLYVEN